MFGVAHIPHAELQILGHLYQFWSHPNRAVDGLLSVFTVSATFAVVGSVFGWVLVRSGNLWYTISLHSLMNSWWYLARPEDVQIVRHLDRGSAMQIATLMLAILVTEIQTRQNRKRLFRDTGRG